MSHILLYSDFHPGTSDLVDHELLSLMHGKSCRVGYIPSDSDTKRRYFAKVERAYSEIGIQRLMYFDLGEEFSEQLIPQLFDCDAIHLSGGDPFRFLALMKQRRFADRLKTYLAKGGILVGVSAGAMILTRSLDIIAAVDEPKMAKKPSPALGFLPFEFYPHFKGDDATASLIQRYCTARRVQVFACDDDAGIRVSDGDMKMLGAVTKFNA